MSSYSIESIKNYLLQLQNNIRVCLEKGDGKIAFKVDHWQRAEGGSGCTMALCDGPVIEKAGVNFSHVWGKNLPAAATNRPQLTGYNFEALGLSVIVHPRNPYAPTCHFNVRFFSAEKKGENSIWWFGGGFDLTPYYGFVDDCQHWHHMAKQACEPFGADIYPRFKKWADDYFYLPHRQEPRGIGGIFFDDWNEWEFERCFSLMQQVGDHFILAYQPILNRRKDMPYGAREREFQCYRRGRYVEFNLVYDRGTLFGLKFGGRIESILISLPPEVKWRYDWQPPAGSNEEKFYKDFLVPKEWI